MPKLVISAAHTSLSPGAIYKDLREFDLTRKILELTVKHLNDQKIEHKAVPVDLSLLDRIQWINNTGYKEESGDIFLEIHVNDGGKRGIEGWFSGEDGPENNSKEFAEILNKELIKSTGFADQGVHSELDHELGSLLILNQTNPIAAAFELLYIDNEEDYKLLKDEKELDKLAKNLVTALKAYIDQPPKLHKGKQDKKGSNLFGGFSPTLPNFSNPFDTDFGDDSDDSDAGGSTSIMMDRDQRKKMIEDVYKKVLGKEPQQNDLNYHLNTGTSEDQLVKKLVNSKDHEKVVEDAKEADELRPKMQKLEAELESLKSKLQDTNAMHESLNKSIQYKNQQLKQMQNELVKRGIIKSGEFYDPARVV